MPLACNERVGEVERELLVPPWLQGTWSSEEHAGDQTTLQQFEFLDGGGVVHTIERCMDSDTGESLPSAYSDESPDATWSWGPGETIFVHGLIYAGWARLDDIDHTLVGRSADDCRILDFDLVRVDTDAQIGLAPLMLGELCFTTPQCWAQTVIECAPTPTECPG